MRCLAGNGPNPGKCEGYGRLVVTFNLNGAPPVPRALFVRTIPGTFEVRLIMLVKLSGGRFVIIRAVTLLFGPPGVGICMGVGAGAFFNSGCWTSKSSIRSPASEPIAVY